jgi:hypothetical protein
METLYDEPVENRKYQQVYPFSGGLCLIWRGIDMIVILEDLPEHVSNITGDQWKKLFAMIPEMENTADFGEVVFKDGAIYPATWAGIVDRFHAYVYEIGLVVDFDWPHWDEGKQILSIEDPDLSKYSAVTLCKLLTAIVRSERFVEGTLIAHFKNGTIVGILRELEKHFG